MSLWIPASAFAVFLAFVVVRAVRSGKREGERLGRVFADLENRPCPACSRSYGPRRPEPPYVTFIPDPPLEDSSCENYWEIRCPACAQVSLAGLPADREVLVFVRPAGGP